jgi:RNA polymerase II subunit A C-terminal domain phosphatase SSU72
LLGNVQVLDDMHSRPLSAMRPALVINLDVKDSHEEAALAAPHALELCSLVSVDWKCGVAYLVNGELWSFYIEKSKAF